MHEHLGEEFGGTVTSAAGFGIFVTLDAMYVEGLVHVTALPGDYYHFDALHHRLSGERSGRSFRLGDTVEVIVARVDLDERKIDFEMSQVGANTDKRPVSAPSKNKDAKPSAGKKGPAAKAKAPAAKKTADAGAAKAKPKSSKRKVVSKSTKAGHYE